MSSTEEIEEHVKEYYGKDVKKTEDLRTTACCVSGETSTETKRLLSKVHDDVISSFYGCGSPLPPMLAGMTVLDLGCGTGRDSYVAAQLVGEAGRVVGVDMTEEQLEVAQRTEDWHAAKFGYAKPNTLFVMGQIDNLKRCGIVDSSVDVVISNCVINLVTDKLKVLKEVFRVLKPGGELFFSDIYSSGHIPDAAKRDKVAWGECLSGALDRAEFRELMKQAGFGRYWTTSTRPVAVDDPEIRRVLGDDVIFYSETVRAIKPAAGHGYEGSFVGSDHGDRVEYLGTIPGYPHAFALGIDSEVFVTGVTMSVDRNTLVALQSSRYGKCFKLTPSSSPAKEAVREWKSPREWLKDGGASMPLVMAIGPQDGSGSATTGSGAGSGGASCCAPSAGAAGSKGKSCC